MHDWITALAALRQRATPVVLVTVASVKGSAPRGAGTRMLVTAGDVQGTIGGGHLEFTAIDVARRQLAGGDSASLQDVQGTIGGGHPEFAAIDVARRQLAGGEFASLRRFPLGASLGQCCGGVVNLLFERVAADAAWIETLITLHAQREAFVVVTPALGSPQNGKLFVTARGAQGSLGTAPCDAAAVAIASELLAGRQRARLATLPGVDGAAGVACFFDPVFPADFNIVLFGAGHVGRALVNILGGVPCALTWVDSRDDAFPADVPGNVEAVVTDAPEAEVDAAAAGSYFLVMTHSHAIDEQLSERILRRADFAYFGLIGSLAKRRQFERRLAARGISAGSLATMICPVGVGGITGKEPGIIAVAVAAQLLQRRAAAVAGASSAPIEHLPANRSRS